MAYSEIINEIDEQIADITTLITAVQADIELKQLEIEELLTKVPQYEEQIAGLQQLRANAQQLIDNQNTLDVNLNVNVNTSGSAGSVSVDHSLS